MQAADRPCAVAVVGLLLAVVVVPVQSVPLQLVVHVAVVDDDEAVAAAVVDMSRSDDAACDVLAGFHDRRDRATRLLLLQMNSSTARSDRVVVPLSCALCRGS